MSSPQEPWKKDMLRRFYHQPGENNISRPIGYKVEGQQKKEQLFGRKRTAMVNRHLYLLSEMNIRNIYWWTWHSLRTAVTVWYLTVIFMRKITFSNKSRQEDRRGEIMNIMYEWDKWQKKSWAPYLSAWTELLRLTIALESCVVREIDVYMSCICIIRAVSKTQRATDTECI